MIWNERGRETDVEWESVNVSLFEQTFPESCEAGDKRVGFRSASVKIELGLKHIQALVSHALSLTVAAL